MYRNARQLHFVRPHVHARCKYLTSGPQSSVNGSSAIIVLWIAALSGATGSMLPKLNIVMQHQMSNEAINRLRKGDRLTLVNFRERWNAIAQIDKAPNGALSVEQRGYCFVREQCSADVATDTHHRRCLGAEYPDASRDSTYVFLQSAGGTFATPLSASAAMPEPQPFSYM
jgi:hypothetical protein